MNDDEDFINIYEGVEDRAITIRPMFEDNSWFRVEWTEHDGSYWEEPERINAGTYFYNCIFHCVAARLDKRTCVEGPLHEVVWLASCIISGHDYEDTRCAVKHYPEGIGFYSPRNSNGRIVIVSKDKAIAGAREFLNNYEKSLGAGI
jgi:hypothetical protein